MPLTGYTANLPTDVLIDSGVLYFGSVVIGVTDGAPKFDPKRNYHQVNFDGKHAPVRLLDRIIHDEAVISATLMEFGGAASGNQLAKLEGGATVATVGAVTTTTPVASGTFMAAGAYVVDLRLLFQRGVAGTYAAIYMPFAICHKWDLQGMNKAEAKISCEFAGRIDLATGNIADPTYRVELRTTLP